MSDSVNIQETIARHLKHASELRKVAATLSLRQARATVLQAAAEHEQLAASLGKQH